MELSTWLEAVAARLQLELPVTDEVVRILLDLARDSAHEVERVAAPLTTFLAGVAVGRGASLPETAQAITDLLALPDPDTQDSSG
ncbi:MAG: DUF6457 domain-containing protein [Friedmanniella sp.]|jgi:hypothetical protein